jgi:hypothetical protein
MDGYHVNDTRCLVLSFVYVCSFCLFPRAYIIIGFELLSELLNEQKLEIISTELNYNRHCFIVKNFLLNTNSVCFKFINMTSKIRTAAIFVIIDL